VDDFHFLGISHPLNVSTETRTRLLFEVRRKGPSIKDLRSKGWCVPMWTTLDRSGCRPSNGRPEKFGVSGVRIGVGCLPNGQCWTGEGGVSKKSKKSVFDKTSLMDVPKLELMILNRPLIVIVFLSWPI